MKQSNTIGEKNERLKKKREERKRRIAEGKMESKETSEPSSMDEKKKIRKLKNRDAAQRARDKARKRLEELNQEVDFLRNQNSLLKKKMVIVCPMCCKETLIKEEGEQIATQSNVSSFPTQQQQVFNYQRIPTFPQFQFPFLFGMLAIIACLFLVYVCPSEQQSSIRILQSAFYDHWNQQQQPSSHNPNLRSFSPTLFKRTNNYYDSFKFFRLKNSISSQNNILLLVD